MEVKFPYGDEIIKSLLLCSVIDTLSQCAYPQKENDGDRFSCFIDNFSGWNNVNRISIVQLYYYLKDKQEHIYEPLKSYATEKVKKMRRGVVYKETYDDYLYNLKYQSAIENEILEYSYSRLFYKYRNYLVHEFRTPGLGSNYSRTSNGIYYYNVTHIDVHSTYRTWELVFPAGYVSKLVYDSTNNLMNYYIEHNLNPYEVFKYDTRWSRTKRIKRKAKNT
jgi:hypothetical protein